MINYSVVMILLLINSLLFSAYPIQVSGTVTDYSMTPVTGAVVRLAKAGAGDTTDENGKFQIYIPSTGVTRVIGKNMNIPLTVQRTSISLTLPFAQTVKMELFTTGGRLVRTIFSGTLNAGINHIPLQQLHASNICILRCRVGGDAYTRRISTGYMQSGITALENAARLPSSFAEPGAAVDNDAVMDMLEIRHPSFTMQKYLLNPYRDSVVAVSIYAINANWITELDSMYIDQEVFASGLENGNYLAMGQRHSAAGDYDLCFFTLDPTGSVLAKNIFGTEENDLGFEFVLQKDNTVRVFGDMWYTLQASHFDLMTIRVSPSGDSLDSRVFVTGDEIMGGHGAITDDGGYVIAGYRSFIDNQSRNSYVPHVTKVSPSGSVSWTKEYTWPYYFSLNSDIIAVADGGFVLSGCSYDDSAADYGIWLLKIDGNGAMLNKTVLKNKQRPYVQKIYETADKKLFLLGKNEINDIEYSYLARFSSDCSLEWDTTILDATKMIWCMTPLKDGSLLLAYNKILRQGTSGLPEEEGIGCMQMKADGTVVKELGPIRHFGHPRSIALGKDNSIIISSASGYTFMQQKFFIININNEFDE